MTGIAKAGRGSDGLRGGQRSRPRGGQRSQPRGGQRSQPRLDSWRHGAVLLLVAVAGCVPGCYARRGLPDPSRLDLPAPSRLERPRPADYPDAHAVVLEDSVRYETGWQLTSSSKPRTLCVRHYVVAVLTQQGVEWAQGSVVLRHGTELLGFAARVIAPDGSLRDIERDEIHEEVVAEDRSSGERYQRRVFRFPGVRPGSILEVRYHTVSEGLAWELWDRPMREVPVRRYRVEILGSRLLRYDFKTYGTRARPLTQDAGEDWVVTLSLRDLPARIEEPYAPHWTLVEPWWVFRTKQLAAGEHTVDGVLGWGDAVAHLAHSLYFDAARPLVRGFDAEVDVTGCRDVPCRIERVSDWVRARTHLDGFSAWNPTPLEDVVASGLADSFSKAILVWHLLRRAGVEAYPAAAVIWGSRRLDRGWPSTDTFDHHLVFVPPQAGLDRPVWVDPACEYCAPGQVPAWLDAGAALVYRPGRPGTRGPRVDASWRGLIVDAPLPATVRIRGAWVLGAEGEATGHAEVEHTGRSFIPIEARLRTRSPEEAEAAAQRSVTSRHPTGRLLAAPAPTCDRAQGRCRQRVEMTLPAFATLAGDRMLVPLGLLSNVWDELAEAERHHDVMVHQDEWIDEVVRIELPPGWTLSEAPPARRVRAPGFDARVAVQAMGDHVLVRRDLVLDTRRIPVAAYPRVRDAVRTFAELRGSTLVLRRTTPEREPAPEREPTPTPTPEPEREQAATAAGGGASP